MLSDDQVQGRKLSARQLRQRREAPVKHGVYSTNGTAPSQSAPPERSPSDDATVKSITPRAQWRRKIRKHVESLRRQYPKLADRDEGGHYRIPSVEVEQLATLDLAISQSYLSLDAGQEGAAAQLERFMNLRERLVQRLGLAVIDEGVNSLMSPVPSLADVTALEQRVIDQLTEEQRGGT